MMTQIFFSRPRKPAVRNFAAWKSAGRKCAALSAVLLFVCTLLMPAVSRAGNLPAGVQQSLKTILSMQQSGTPDKATLDTLLEFAMSPLNLKGTDDKAPEPDKHEGAHGIFWRNKIPVPLSTTLQYLYNPNVPTTMVFPASIRYASWQPGSGLLARNAPLSTELGKHKDAPLVLRGVEVEEVAPDTNSSAYYKYSLDRLIMLTEYEGKQALVSVSWQRGPSEPGKKAAVIGEYNNWDFVYSDIVGTLAKGITWAETYVYDSASLSIFYEDGNNTGYSMFNWMDAGWKKMNMVKSHHIKTGADRSFAGLKAFLTSPARPSPQEIATYADALKRLPDAALRERFAPYSAKVEEAAASNDTLKSEEFQKLIKDGGYGKSLDREQLLAGFYINYVKAKLGKPLLAGPLN